MKTRFNPNKLLITGGAGFIGLNFIQYLLAENNDIHIVNIDKLTYAANPDHDNILGDKSRYCFVQGDITDQQLVSRLLREHDIDTVVHFAAESHVDRSITGPGDFIQTNIVGTFTLLEACRDYWLHEKHYHEQQCRFHHISTDEVFGSLTKADPAFNENTPYAPNSPYSASKASSDHLVRAYHHTYQLPVTTTNCSNNYGPYQHGEKFIPTIIQACLQQKPIPVYGNGSHIRDWLYVLDHCRGIETVLYDGINGQTYQIGGEQEMSNMDMTRTICGLMDERYPDKAPHATLIQFVTDRPGHDWRYAIDIRKIKQALHWQPQEDIQSGLNKTIDFYVKQFNTKGSLS